MISFYRFDPSWSTWRWFNISGPCFKIAYRRRVNFIHLWTLFNRHTADGDHWWGVGVLQIGNYHLFYIGHGGISVAFIGRTD
jgi:hypothetical protein